MAKACTTPESTQVFFQKTNGNKGEIKRINYQHLKIWKRRTREESSRIRWGYKIRVTQTP